MPRMTRGGLLLATIGLLAAAGATRGAHAQQAVPDEDWKPTKIENLKVLPKETTPDQIMTIMKGYNEALSVECVACHKGKIGAPLSTFEFADDAKENKEITRSMIQMTTDINTKYPEGLPEATAQAPLVTCATCHRRNRHPETDLPPKPPKGL